MSRDHHDALIDQLLREILGGDRPRDLTERVMARAREYDRVRLRWWVGTVSAVAASIAIAALVWLAWPKEYPSERVIDGVVEVTNGDQVQRGARLVTKDEPAHITIGGYVDLQMRPSTALTLGGTKFAEVVLLEQGDVDVSVTKRKGSFDVKVGQAYVHVTGTKFHVGVNEDIDTEHDLINRKLLVSVSEGSVEVRGLGGGPVELSAATGDSSRLFPISSTPRVIKAAPSLSEGASQPELEGGRRFPAIARGNMEPATRPGRGGQGRGRGQVSQQNTQAFTLGRGGEMKPTRPLQVVVQQGTYTADGILRMVRTGHYFLATEFNGNILLYSQQTPPTRMPPPGTRVSVTWKDGNVQKIELEAPKSAAAGTQPAGAAGTRPMLEAAPADNLR